MGENFSVEIKLFAAAVELAGSHRICLSVPRGLTVEELQNRLVAECPDLRMLAQASRWAVNEEFVDREFVVEHAANIALIPPVSGG